MNTVLVSVVVVVELAPDPDDKYPGLAGTTGGVDLAKGTGGGTLLLLIILELGVNC